MQNRKPHNNIIRATARAPLKVIHIFVKDVGYIRFTKMIYKVWPQIQNQDRYLSLFF